MIQEQLAQITIQLDRERTIRFNFKALHLLEKILGSKAFTLIDDLATKVKGEKEDAGRSLMGVIGFTEARALLYAGLIHEDKTLTVERAEELMEEAPGESPSEKFGYIVAILYNAYVLFWMGSKKKVGELPAGPLQNGNGIGMRSASSPSVPSS